MTKKKIFVFELVCYAYSGTHRFLFTSKDKALKFIEDIPSSFHFEWKINKVQVL